MTYLLYSEVQILGYTFLALPVALIVTAFIWTLILFTWVVADGMTPQTPIPLFASGLMEERMEAQRQSFNLKIFTGCVLVGLCIASVLLSIIIGG